MNQEQLFLSTLVKESSEDALFKEALSIVSLEELEKIAGDEITGHVMHGSKVLPLPVIGALAGAAYGALSDPGVDPETGEQKGRFGNMLAGAAGGTIVGAGAKHVGNVARRLHGPTGDYLRESQKMIADSETSMRNRHISRDSIAEGQRHARAVGRAKSIAEAQEKAKAEAKEKATEEKPKESSVKLAEDAKVNTLKSLGEFAKTHLRSGADYLHEAGPAGVAAGAAVLNAARKFVMPDKDKDGEDKDRLEEAAKGAIHGGLAGLALGHGIKHMQPAIKGEKTVGENISDLYDAAAKHLSKKSSVEKTANLGAVVSGGMKLLSNPLVRHAAKGMAGGAIMGGADSLLNANQRPVDPRTGRRQGIGTTLARGMVGGAKSGALHGAVAGAMGAAATPSQPNPRTPFQGFNGPIS